MKNISVKIIVATHKNYQMPSDSMYIPLLVGAKNSSIRTSYLKDDKGDNISELNPSFCELTGLYWAWKHIDAEYIGLSHYRRHFSLLNKKGFKNVLTYEQIKPYLHIIKIFVPKKRKYFIETLYSHYAHTHYAIHLDETRKIISDLYPDYLKNYDKVVKQKYGYMFNMMIMEKKYFNKYCSWLFDILFELQKRIIKQNLSTFQNRFYGRVSEIIFNVWLDKMLESGELNSSELKEVSFVYMEKINWFKKGISFLMAKCFGKKYKGSF